MSRYAGAEWEIGEAGFPAGGSASEKLRYLVGYAILAPSGHNTQPWLFGLDGDRLYLRADRTRRLPVVDPADRALVISCGAALGNLRAAMLRFGYRGEIELLPDSSDPELLARIGLGGRHAPTEWECKRFRAITKRRSTRTKFESEPLPAGLAQRLTDLAAADRVEARVIVDEASKRALAALVAEGDREQFADQAFRRELASWVHSRRASSRDGMSGSNFGMPDLLSPIGAAVIRTFDMGDGIAAKDQEIAAHSPALLVIATGGDEPENWLRAGMAHMGVLLEIAAAGLTAAYLNQPVEVGRLRPLLRSAAGTRGIPQLLLRMGRGPQVAPAVRRPVDTVTSETWRQSRLPGAT
jgi:hypothetical protein